MVDLQVVDPEAVDWKGGATAAGSLIVGQVLVTGIYLVQNNVLCH